MDDLNELPRFKFKPWPSVYLVMVGTGALIAVVVGASVYLGTHTACANVSDLLRTLFWVGSGLCICLFSEILAAYNIRQAEISASSQAQPESRKH